MGNSVLGPHNWSLACYFQDNEGSKMRIVHHQDGKSNIVELASDETKPATSEETPVMLAVTQAGKALTMDPVTKSISSSDSFPVYAFAAHAYPDPQTQRVWYMNDGDKDTGNDTINCGNEGSSVWIVDNIKSVTGTDSPQCLATVCVGRGHHVTAFSYPSDRHPDLPKNAYVSNLLDGSISVIGNDPDHSDSYLKLITTINLYDAAKEEGEPTIPNKANPHGMTFSHYTGKVYNLNNGYATVSVIDPATSTIVDNLPLDISKVIMLSPCGRFLIGKGSDRKADPEHVIGKLNVIDLESGKVVNEVDVADVYPAKYSISEDGGQLYVTTASTGSDAQQANLKKDVFCVFDSSQLPKLMPIAETKVGLADCHTRAIELLECSGRVERVFVSNPSDGTVSVLDGGNNSVLETIQIAGHSSRSRVWIIK